MITDFLDTAAITKLTEHASGPLTEIAGGIEKAFGSRLRAALAGVIGALPPEAASVTLFAHRGGFDEPARARSQGSELSFVYVAPGSTMQRLRVRDPKGALRVVPAPPNSLVVFAAGLACELIEQPSHPGPLILRGTVSRRAHGRPNART